MTKKAIDNSVEIYNPETDYKSIERRISDSIIPPLSRWTKDFVTAFYGLTFNTLKVPTVIRKIRSGQTILQIQDNPFSGSGTFFGGVAGYCVDGLLMAYTAKDLASDPSYGPYVLAGWLATNLVSGIYELGRRGQSRREHLGYKNFLELQEKEMKAKEKAKKKNARTKP